jgi:hypothetical protein
LLKKVVERVQAENERLKKAPGVVTNEQMALVKRENDQLRVTQTSCTAENYIFYPPRIVINSFGFAFLYALYYESNITFYNISPLFILSHCQIHQH